MVEEESKAKKGIRQNRRKKRRGGRGEQETAGPKEGDKEKVKQDIVIKERIRRRRNSLPSRSYFLSLF